MAKVVFTTIKLINDLGTAVWRDGDNCSYENTKRMVPCCDDIKVIARQANDGSVRLVCASSGSGNWADINEWHLSLVKFFEQKILTAPAGDTLPNFFDQIEEPAAKNAAQQLIALECGVNVTKERSGKLQMAVLQVQRGLRALGLTCGDWTFVPMFNSFEVAK